MNDLTALILCGGLGTRLRPLTFVTPKPLIKVGTKRVIDYIFSSLHDSGISRIIVDVHHLAWDIIRYVGDRALISYKTKLMGTAGTMLPLLPYLSDPFFVLNGDTISNIRLDHLFQLYQRRGKYDHLACVFSKDTMEHNGGIYFLAKKPLDQFLQHSPTPTFLHSDYLPRLPKGTVALYDEAGSYYFDVGTLEKLKKAREFFAGKN